MVENTKLNVFNETKGNQFIGNSIQENENFLKKIANRCNFDVFKRLLGTPWERES